MRIPLDHALKRALRLSFAAGAIGIVALAPSQAASGATVATVPAGIADNCSTDVSAPLLAWINSVPDNSVLSFASGACYRIEHELEITDRHGLTFEGNGATFEATTPGDGHRPQWRFVQGSGLTLRNMTIDGGNGQAGTFNAALQQEHGIELMGPAGVEIDRVHVTNVYGDCFYVGQGFYNKAWSNGVHVHDSTCAGTGRMGVAVTAGRDVLVERTSFAQIAMTVFDIEPNGAGFGASGITFTNNQVRGIELFDALGDGPVDSITVSNNVITGQGTRMTVIARPGQRRTNITISGNTNDTPYSNPGSVAIDAIRVDGLTITRNAIPLGAPNMALVDVSESCNVSISGNSYPGGVAEARIHPYGGVCPAPSSPTAVTGTGGAATTPSSANAAAAAATAAKQKAVAAQLAQAELTAPRTQDLKTVRRRGLVVRFAGEARATWTLTATLRKASRLHPARLRTAHGVLARATFKARAGNGLVRMRIPKARLVGIRTMVVRVRARVTSGSQSVVRTILVRVTAGAPAKSSKA